MVAQSDLSLHSGERCFLPDEVSLQANDPLDDLLLGIPRGPERTININKAISIKTKQENKANKNYTSVMY